MPGHNEGVVLRKLQVPVRLVVLDSSGLHVVDGGGGGSRNTEGVDVPSPHKDKGLKEGMSTLTVQLMNVLGNARGLGILLIISFIVSMVINQTFLHISLVVSIINSGQASHNIVASCREVSHRAELGCGQVSHRVASCG